MAITRLGINGFGSRLTGSFLGKTESGAVRPIGKITRLGLNGYTNPLTGYFSGKTPDSGDGEHPVGLITRLGLSGFGVRRTGDFSGRKEAITIIDVGGGDDRTSRRRNKVCRTKDVYSALQRARNEAKKDQASEIDSFILDQQVYEAEKKVVEHLTKAYSKEIKRETIQDFVGAIRFSKEMDGVSDEDIEQILLILLIDEVTQ